MGLNTDATAIQFRMLNASKGPSVRAPRAQCDKTAYRARMKMVLETVPGIRLFQGDVVKLLVNGEQQVTGAVTFPGLHHLRAQRGHLLRNIHAGAAARGPSAHNGRPHGLRSFQPFHRPRRAWLSSGTA